MLHHRLSRSLLLALSALALFVPHARSQTNYSVDVWTGPANLTLGSNLYLNPTTLAGEGYKVWFVADLNGDGVATNVLRTGLVGGDNFLVHEDFITDGSTADGIGNYFNTITLSKQFTNANIYVYIWNSTSSAEAGGDTFGIRSLGTNPPPQFGNPVWLINGPVYANQFTVLGFATNTWNFNNSDNWSVGASWVGGVSPVSSSTNLVVFGGTSTYYSTNDLGNFHLNVLEFNNSAGTVNLVNPSGNRLIFTNEFGAPEIGLHGAGGAVVSNGVLLATNLSVLGNGAGSLTLSGEVTGTGQIMKSGSSTLALLSSNSFVGQFTMGGGTLLVGDNGAFGLNTLRLNSGTIAAADSNARQIGNQLVIAGNATFGQSSGGTGELDFQGGISLGGVNSRILTVNNPVTRFSGVVSNGGFSKAGTGALLLDAANTFTGGTILNAGTLLIGDTLALGTGNLSINAGTLASADATAYTLPNSVVVGGDFTLGQASGGTGTLTIGNNLNFGFSTRAITVANPLSVISGVIQNGQLTKTGAGALLLSGNNTFDNGVILNNGTLLIGSSGALNAGDNTLTLNGGTLGSGDATARTIANTVNVGGDFTLGQTSGGTGALTFSSGVNLQGGVRAITVDNATDTISGVVDNGGLTKAGTGTLVLSGANTFADGLAVNGGTLSVGGDGNLGDPSSPVSLNGGALRATGTFTLDPARGVLTVGASGGGLDVTGANTLTQAGALTGTGSLTKSGTGTLVLSNNNTGFSGKVAVTGGTLSVSNSINLGAVPGATVADQLTLNGGTLAWTRSGSNEVQRGITLGGSGGTINVSTSVNFTNNAVITGAGALTKAGAGTLLLPVANNSLTGGVTLGAGTLSLGDDTALGTGTLTINGGTLTSSSSANRSLTNAVVVGGNFTLGSSGTGRITNVGTINLGGASRTVTLSGGHAWTNTVSNGGVILAGSGNLRVSGSNTLVGASPAWTVNTGTTLEVTSDAALGGAPVSFVPDYLVIDGGVLSFTNGSSAAYTLHTNRGIRLGNGNANPGSIFVDSGPTLTNYNSVISDGGTGNALIKGAAGTLRQEVVNTYSGGTVVSGGTLLLAGTNTLFGTVVGDGALGAAGTSVQVNNATLQQTAIEGAAGGFGISAARTLSLGGSGNTNFGLLNNVQHYGVIANAGTANGLRVTGGTVRLGTANTFTGQTRIESGSVLELAGDGGLGTVPGTVQANRIMFSDATLRATNSFILNANRGIGIGLGAATDATAIMGATAGVTLTYGGFISNAMGAAGSMARFTKTNAGEVVLTGNHTLTGAYNGPTRIEDGRLVIGLENNIGTNVVVLNGSSASPAFLRVTNSLTFTGANHNRTFIGTNNNTRAGGFDIDTGLTVTYNGVISGGSTTSTDNSHGFRKDGGGTLVLTTNQAFGGETHVLRGTLQLATNQTLYSGVNLLNASNYALAAANALQVFTGTLDLQSFTQRVGAITLAPLTGYGTQYISSATSPRIIGGANSELVLDGNVTYAGGPAQDSGGAVIDANLLRLTGDRTFTVSNSSAAVDLHIASVITNDVGGVVRNFTKAGGGVLVLSNNTAVANSFSNTTVTGGTLRLGFNEQLPNGRSLTVNNATFDLDGRTETINTLTVGGAAGQSLITLGSGGVLTNNGDITYSATGNPDTALITGGTYSLGTGNRTFTINDSSATTTELIIDSTLINNGTSRTLSKAGLGTLVLSNVVANANTFGPVTMNSEGGILRLGADEQIPNSQLLQINGTTNFITHNSYFDLNGRTETVGSLQMGNTNSFANSHVRQALLQDSSVGGVLQVNGTVTYNAGTAGTTFQAGQTTIDIDTLRLGADVTFSVPDSTNALVEMLVAAVITNDIAGANARLFTKSGGGVLVLSNATATANNFSNLTVNGGTLRLAANNQLPDDRSVTVNANTTGSAAILDLAGNNDSIGALTLGGAGGTATSTNRVITGAGTLTLGGNVLVINTGNWTTPASITGNVSLGGADRTFDVADSTGTAVDLDFSASLSGTGVGIVKTGAGTLQFSNANTFTGATVISNGVLRLAYGANNSLLSDTANLVLNGVTLDLAGTAAHTEVVGATVLTGSLTRLTRSTGAATIDLNTITLGTASTLDVALGSIALTDNPNTVAGIIDSRITVAGGWASNSIPAGGGFIVPLTGLLDVTRLSSGTKTIADGVASNVRVVEGTGTAGDITMAAAGTTTINSLAQGAEGSPANINIGAGNTLRIASGSGQGILLANGYGSLFFTNGTLTAGAAANTAATLAFVNNNPTNVISVVSSIANNGTGVVGVRKDGVGNLILATNNTMTGGITVVSGTLTAFSQTTNRTTLIPNVRALGPTNNLITLNANTVLDIRDDGTNLVATPAPVRQTLLYSNNITVAGNARINLDSATGLYTNTVRLGRLTIGNSTLTTTHGNGYDLEFVGATLTDDATINIGTSGRSVSFTAPITGGAGDSLTLTGSGNLFLNGTSSTYGGGTIANGGTLVLNAAGAAGTGNVTLQAGTVQVRNADGFRAGAGPSYVNLQVTGTGTTLDLRNNASTTFTANNVDIDAAVPLFILNGNRVSGTGTGFTLTLASPITTHANTTLRSTAGNTYTNVISGNISLGGNLIVSNIATGPLRISGVISESSGTRSLTKDGVGSVQLSGANTYSGNTVVNGGVLQAGAANTIPSGSGKGNVSVGVGAVLDVNSFSQTVNGLSGAGTVDSTSAGTPTLTAGANNQSSVFGGTIQNTAGTLALIKIGSGTLELSGNNTFSGAATVGAGTLDLSGNGALGAATVVNVNGGTLRLTGSGAVNRVNNLAAVSLGGGTIALNDTGATGVSETLGALTLTATSIIDFGTLNGASSVLTFGDSQANGWFGTLEVYNWSGTHDFVNGGSAGGPDQLVFTGAGLTGTQLGQVRFWSDAGTTWLGYGKFIGSEVVPTPEPATWVSLGALASLLGWRERRRLARLVRR